MSCMPSWSYHPAAAAKLRWQWKCLTEDPGSRLLRVEDVLLVHGLAYTLEPVRLAIFRLLVSVSLSRRLIVLGVYFSLYQIFRLNGQT